ncbi:MAG: sortase [Chloroflexota bacterium]|nr:sortase [Chloroflexota bacterium]MQG37365.1 sortase [SAR202 cluster bacterium]|tara:strand:+ start:108 stop:989 length:882 start_codon:yes stop_codon:yes gene_type:complete
MVKTPIPATDKPLSFSVLAISAYAMVLLGVALIVASSWYFYSRMRSGSDADKFTYSIPKESLGNHLGRSIYDGKKVPVESKDPIPLTQRRASSDQFANLYPGALLNPKYWSQPEWAGSDPYGGPTIPDEFFPVLSTDIFQNFNPNSKATGIRIPSINVDATVVDLGIIDVANERSYETPDNTVGHIPETPNPGQPGRGWFFGHLESFTTDEGNIFRHLPEVTDLIKEDPVDIYLQTSDAEFIYRVTTTSQMHEESLQLTASNDAQITLVTCWPPQVYDQRILVNATLIAYRYL